MKKIIAFSGSNSKASINQQLIQITANIINHSEVEVEVLNLRDFEAPIYGIDLETDEGFPDSMKALSNKFDSADAFIVSTPEHNGAMPAVLKNTIDWLSRIEGKVFREKPTVFLSTSPGPRGGVTALENLVNIMPYRGAQVVGHYSLGSFGENVIDGKLNDIKQTELLSILDKLISSL